MAVVENEPLAVCDTQTVQDSDWEMIEKILDEAVEESMYLKRRDRHKWYWMEKQTSYPGESIKGNIGEYPELVAFVMQKNE